MRQAQAKALSHGATVHDNLRVEWDASGRCEAPVTVELHARPDRVLRFGRAWSVTGQAQEKALRAVQAHFPGATLGENNEWVPRRLYSVSGPVGSATLTMHVPCRKCARCLRTRANIWRERARAELATATWRGGRSWFVTLTCRPDVHHAHLAMTRVRLDTQGIDFGTLPKDEQFRERHRPLAMELTKWLKRVRKTCGARFRYLAVTEIHMGGGDNDGQPHLHLLMHEVDPATPLRERVLRTQWPHGHAKAKLVTSVEAGVYLCKYLSKDARARVRASGRYGERSEPDGLKP